jgi:hypothetical protein
LCETLTLEFLIMTEKSLYERLGGVFAIAAVVDHFSDAVVQNPSVGVPSISRKCLGARRRKFSPPSQHTRTR